jgi:glucose/arabinose dehydrogenase
MKFRQTAQMIALGSIVLLSMAAAGQVTALPPYTVSTFATSVLGVYFQPDSIAAVDGHIFIGFGNNVSTTGGDGKSSTIVEYDAGGNVLKMYSVLGHNDGLKVDPRTKLLWAMQNEDANPNLVIIDPVSGSQTLYTFAAPPPHGGGYDDIAFVGNEVFFSCSNPANNPNNAPAIVQAQFSGNTIHVTPVLMGTATATDIPTDTPIALNLQDPDSMHFNPFGDLVLDSQADGELIIIHHPGINQSVYHLALTLNGAAVQIDDTDYATSSHGVLLVSDRDGETVYSITKDIFKPGAAYSATPTSVGALDLDTGVITSVVTGMVSPHGMTFLGNQQ